MKVSVFDALLHVLALIIAAAPVLCDEFTILTSATSNCPGELTGELCLTLEEYVSSVPGQGSEIILSLQPGLHSLPADFLVSSSTQSFSMTSAGATIACDTRSRLLTWTSVESINITGISFKGCGIFRIDGAVRVQFVDVAITNSGPTSTNVLSNMFQITASLYASRLDPASSAVLHNVTFQNNSGNTLIYRMYTIVFEHVTCINTFTMTVEAWDGTVTIGGGASHSTVQLGPQTTFTMTQSLFSHNTGGAGGSGLRLLMNKGYIGNSTFVHNEIGLYAQYMTLTVENSVFSHSSRSALTGLGSNLTMTNCTLSSNTDSALLWGGNVLKLQNNMFVNNRAILSGGGMSISGLTIIVISCTFYSNTATLKGGAMYVYPYNMIITSKNVFIDNLAAEGGALYLEYSNRHSTNTTLYFTDDVFEGNNASVSGGAIYSDISGLNAVLSVIIRNSTFHNNVAVGKRGGAIFSAGLNVALSFVESTFDSNSAPSCGVVDASNHISVDFNSSSFMDNIAMGEVIGGGVACVRNASVSIGNVTFTYNKANPHAGVLYLDNSSVSISDSTFLGNSATANGGVFYTRILSTEYSISHSAFIYNSAGDSGGVMYLNGESSQATVTESIISFNRAANRGGAFSIISSSLNITRSNIYNNTANIGNSISACNSVVQVQELNSSVDSTQPICNLYEGFVNTFDIVPPHDFNDLVTNSPPTSSPLPTVNSPSNPPLSSSPPPGSDPPPVNNPSPTSNLPPASTSCPPTTPAIITESHSTSTSIDLQPGQDKDEVERLTILVYTFAAIIIALMLCIIPLAIKVIYDCVRARLPKYRRMRSFSLEVVDG